MLNRIAQVRCGSYGVLLCFLRILCRLLAAGGQEGQGNRHNSIDYSV
jgi:hypothetical protein